MQIAAKVPLLLVLRKFGTFQTRASAPCETKLHFEVWNDGGGGPGILNVSIISRDNKSMSCSDLGCGWFVVENSTLNIMMYVHRPDTDALSSAWKHDWLVF